MNIPKLKELFEELIENINSRPESAASIFFPKFDQLEYDEKDVISVFIKRHYEIALVENRIPLENQMYLTEIHQKTDTEYLSSMSSFPTLTLAKGVKSSQIASFFIDLKKDGFLTDDKAHIADAVATIFNLNPGTIKSYFNDTSKVNKVNPLIKNHSEDKDE